MLYPLSYQSVADTRDRTRDLQIFSLTLSQLSYIGESTGARKDNKKQTVESKTKKLSLEGLEPPIF